MIEFDYKPFPKSADTPRPVAEITFVNNDKKRRWICMIDSGADYTVLPYHFLPLLGIDLKDVKKYNTKYGCACGKGSTRGYFYPIRIEIPGHDKQIKINVIWAEADIQPLLGRNGILDHFDIIFKKGEKKVIFDPK